MKNYDELNITIWDTDKYMLGIDAETFAYEGPRNVALDLGAHVGTRSLWLATDGGFEKVYAVEMEPRNFQMLCKNVKQNGLEEVVIPILAAVSDQHEFCPVYFGTANRGQYSTCYDSEIKPRVGRVMAVPLSILLNTIGYAIDFMKMDLEGAEYKVFANANPLLFGGTRYLFLERHGPNKDYFSDNFFSNLGYDPQDPQARLFNYLKNCGFEDIQENSIGQIMVYNNNVRSKENAL